MIPHGMGCGRLRLCGQMALVWRGRCTEADRLGGPSAGRRRLNGATMGGARSSSSARSGGQGGSRPAGHAPRSPRSRHALNHALNPNLQPNPPPPPAPPGRARHLRHHHHPRPGQRGLCRRQGHHVQLRHRHAGRGRQQRQEPRRGGGAGGCWQEGGWGWGWGGCLWVQGCWGGGRKQLWAMGTQRVRGALGWPLPGAGLLLTCPAGLHAAHEPALLCPATCASDRAAPVPLPAPRPPPRRR